MGKYDKEYYRDELNNNITMGEIGLLQYEDVFNEKVFIKIIISTILMLHIKKYVKIEKESDNETTIIIEKNTNNKEPLKESEKYILECLKKSDINKDGKIKTKELRNKATYLLNEDRKKIKECIVKDAIKNNYIDEKRLKKKSNHFSTAVVFLIGIILSILLSSLYVIILRFYSNYFRHYRGN